MTEEPNRKEGEFDETTSYSFLYFLVAGATLFVTLWAFWDDEYTRRGYKEFQDVYFKEQFARAETEYKTVTDKIHGKEQEIVSAIVTEEQKLNSN